MDRVEASLVLCLPPERVYDRLFEYTEYHRHTPYLDDVTVRGRGVGTDVSLEFSWWKLSYTARGRVTGVDPPNRIEWETVGGLDARGHWSIEPAPEEAPPDADTATRARIRIEFDRENSRVRLPPMVSVGWVIRRVKPIVGREAEKLARAVVADVEGERRPVELRVHAVPETV